MSAEPARRQRADGEVAQGRHGARCGASPELAGVFGDGDVPDPVQAVLDRPVSADVAGELPGCGLGGGQAGHGVDGDGAPSSAGKVADAAGELDGLGGMREAQATHDGDLQGADLDPAVALVAGVV
jgi:hypothetical protein